MILSIDSSIKTFKTLSFRPGLNILLADTANKDAAGKTRNSAGKSSFVQIVDFLMGANCDRKSLFRSDALIDASFSGTFQFRQTRVSIERSGSDPSKFFLQEGEALLVDLIKTDKDTNRAYVSASDWKNFLGATCFGLPQHPKTSAFGEKYAPSPRTMLKYFMRLDGDGGFLRPERSNGNAQRSNYQTALSYMFGLEWKIAQEFQKVRDTEKTLEALKRAADGGAVDELVGTVAKLRPQVAIADQKAQKKRDEIAAFQVLESYKELSDEAATFQRSMQDASQRLVTLKETLSYLEDALKEEEPHYSVDVHAVYRASGIELPDIALKRLEDVVAFQSSIIANRKIHLQSEIDGVKRDIETASQTLSASGAARKRILVSLQGKGAFEDLVGMQRELATLEAEAATLKERYKAAEALEGQKAELKVDRIELQRRLLADHATHQEKLNTVILRIADLIANLYEDREGRFEITATDNGPEFDIHIEGDRGGGIRSMEIFCMDMALFEAVRRQFAGTGFLIHDSHLFDGVDPRQIVTALLLGAQSMGTSDQYIVTMNSDIFDSLPIPEGFNISECVLPLRLSDEGESGGLFGFRFE